MTTYTELAKDPQAFDTELARLHAELATARRDVEAVMNRMHKAAGDTRSFSGWGVNRVVRWQLSDDEALARATAIMRHEHANAVSHRNQVTEAIAKMDRVYAAQARPWTRFFPSVTKSQPHIHRSLHCRTLHPTTVMSWAPQLSGKTDEVAVAELDEALCSVCFPDAPVALHNYQSKRSQAERDERQAAKDEREAKKAAKTLTEAEQFRTGGRYGERVTTVAKCKELVRKAVELEVEAEYWAARSPEGWTPEQIARRQDNLVEDIARAHRDAGRAASVLMLRERLHEGHGATMEDIAKMRTNKEKSARKEWGL